MSVKRYRWHHDGMWCFEPGEVRTTAQWVSAADYDALLTLFRRQAQCLRPIRDAGKDCHCAVCEALRDTV